MASTNLILHKGARLVDRTELEGVEAPSPTATWYPLKHAQVLDRVSATLQEAGFAVASMRLALSRNDARFFGTLDLTTPVVSGVTLAVGVRNSMDKSFPIGFAAGRRVFICDNLAFHSEIAVARKHTRYGEQRFREAICSAVQSLQQFKEAERSRILRFQNKEVSDIQAESLLLRAFERGLLSHRVLPEAICHWRKPSFEEFEPRTLWSLENAFTSALAGMCRSNPHRFCALTIAVQHLIGEAAGSLPGEPQMACAA